MTICSTGLAPKGVPKALQGTVLPFHYNKIEELEKIVTENEGKDRGHYVWSRCIRKSLAR
jgi:hypothetical protein